MANFCNRLGNETREEQRHHVIERQAEAELINSANIFVCSSLFIVLSILLSCALNLTLQPAAIFLLSDFLLYSFLTASPVPVCTGDSYGLNSYFVVIFYFTAFRKHKTSVFRNVFIFRHFTSTLGIEIKKKQFLKMT